MTDEVAKFIKERIAEMKNDPRELFRQDSHSPFAGPYLQAKIDISPDLFFEFKQASKKHGVPMSRQVENYIERRLPELEALFAQRRTDNTISPVTK